MFAIDNLGALGRYKHENRVFDDILIGNYSFSSIWNEDDKEPNLRFLTALDFALSSCPNLVSVVFHHDGFFPSYRELQTALKSAKEENAIYCLGEVRPGNYSARRTLRQFGYFTRDYWRSDHLAPDERIPNHCSGRNGFIMNKSTGSAIKKALSRTTTFEFRNGDIFQTGIMRLKVWIFSFFLALNFQYRQI